MKKLKIENIRVFGEPDIWFTENEINPNEYRRSVASACKRAIEEIEKHCSDDIIYLDYEWDETEYCSFCNEEWNEDDKGYPTCCEEAEDEYLAEKMKKSL